MSCPVVILAGGMGTRLAEETGAKPKPMVEVGGRPILWHIMKIYAAYGFKEFVVALGYKGEVIKDFFLNYRNRTGSLTIKTGSGETTIHNEAREDWTVHLLDTGLTSETGGRVKRAAEFIGQKTFLLTYGDGVANMDVRRLLDFHKHNRKLATITAVRPGARFGSVSFNGDLVAHFEEKPQIGEGWINGGFFVLEPGIVRYLKGDASVFERDPLEHLARDKQLAAYRHEGFWHCMDTLRDKRMLDELWNENRAPWRVWA